MLQTEHTLGRVMLSSPHFSCLCFKFGQVILPHTMSSPQFLFPSPQVSSESPLVSKGPFCPKRACESMWIRAIPHRSGSIDSTRAVDGSTYYKYIAGIVHISMNAECCEEPTEDCGSGAPATCNNRCAAVLVPYYEDCEATLLALGDHDIVREY